MANEIVRTQDDGIVHARISGEMTPVDQKALEGLAKELAVLLARNCRCW